MMILARLIRISLHTLALLGLSFSVTFGQSKPVRVLVMHWYGRDDPSNDDFDLALQSALESSAPGRIEYYSEYLETNKFPGEPQSTLLSNYLRQKYAGRTLDVIVSGASATLDFLLKYRRELFPHTPIVFATDRPIAAPRIASAGATGFYYAKSYGKTVDLTLKLHPDTKQIFVVSGTLNHDGAIESIVRDDLRPYINAKPVKIIYLTDLTLEALTAALKTLPNQSLVLYAWQQSLDSQGKVLESLSILKRVAPEANVPIYGKSFAQVGFGIVGGYVWTREGMAAKLAELTLRIANGARPQDIPVEDGPDVPMFDRRQLQRWSVREDRLPSDSIIRFREPTVWQQYKWRIIATMIIFILQSSLIGALFFEWRKARLRAAALTKAQQLVRESEERFRNIANSAPVLIAIADSNGLAKFFNKGWLDFTGRSLEQELGQGWTEGLHPDDREECLAKFSAWYQARSNGHLEYRLRRVDGEYRSLMCNVVPRLEANGDFVGYIASLIDITEIKRSQEKALANQKLQSLGVLAGGVAHDFNNLLGGIIAESELLISDLENVPQAQAELQTVRSLATRGTEIVRQLMAYAGQATSAFEEVDLAELVREMLQLLTVSIAKSAALKIDLPAIVPPIRANPSQIRQVVMNLITNASDALKDRNGCISVTIRQVNAREAGVSDHGDEWFGEDWLRLEVSDSGCGMTKEVQARIFDPFFSTKSEGRGLGLAAVRGIVESHRGTIEVASRLGEGSTFVILLPCVTRSRNEPCNALISASSSEQETAIGTILMIEDEDYLRLPVAKLLRGKGISVIEASDGAEGVKLFRDHAKDVTSVLLDLSLSGISGQEVLMELRKIHSSVKVILTTAHCQERLGVDVGDKNCVFYLQKPYGISRLIALLRSIVRGDTDMKQATAG